MLGRHWVEPHQNSAILRLDVSVAINMLGRHWVEPHPNSAILKLDVSMAVDVRTAQGGTSSKQRYPEA
ncbi:hypothetical protein RRG08_050943 [Elysia crispata]|uniref:Uncharacterized protein n=1 Tax=Elysia crispata TaxID=231223 RepID=A0AAE0YQA2_9GAST|nr:hypothetical protein RRG08_050943 [Elysia crispata]